MKKFIKSPNVLFIIVLIGYSYVSKVLFDKVYITSVDVIDEHFHLPQGIAYCKYNFSFWNPKITTLPGLYIISTVLLGHFKLCTIYSLRFTSLLSSIFNLILFYVLFQHYNPKEPLWKQVLNSLNLSLLPPLYFFNHLYYTDVVSLSSVLLMVYFYNKRRHFIASTVGMFSILMRQTNVIWVFMLFGEYLLRCIVCNLLGKNVQDEKELKVFKNDLRSLYLLSINKLLMFWYLPHNVWLNILAYASILLSFFMFVLLNGGIVVGDREAHTVALHIPQLMYFALFYLFFGWPLLIKKMYNFINVVCKRKILFISLIIILSVIIYFNTLVHPYLLADNRHYIFYVWNYFYGRYIAFKYLIIPVYLFGFFCMLSNAFEKDDISFGLIYFPCTIFVLILQKLIEVRYFLIPYVFLRLNMKNVTAKELILEFILYLFINIVTFKMFFTKIIYWIDFDDPQRLIW